MNLFPRAAPILDKLGQISSLVWESAFHPIAGEPRQLITAKSEELGVTFIGHSSFLVQMADRNILIDPVFANRLVLLRRFRRPGMLLADLPRIDLVLLTHAHMDHLNRASLKRIIHQQRQRHGQSPIVVVPERVEDLVNNLGFSQVVAIEQWQSKPFLGVEITRTPSRHWGARFFSDTHRGFGGYVLRAGSESLYHSGDTAYFSGFREIGRRLSPSVALLPIGAYYPESFRTVHTSPEDALQAFLDLGARWMIPMHFGTFRLSYEPMDEPAARLRSAAAGVGVEGSLCILSEGETALFDANGIVHR